MQPNSTQPGAMDASESAEPPAISIHVPDAAAQEPTAAEVDMTRLLLDYLGRTNSDKKQTYAEGLIEAWVKMALAGNFRALQEILERTETAAPPPGPPASFDDREALNILEDGGEIDPDAPVD